MLNQLWSERQDLTAHLFVFEVYKGIGSLMCPAPKSYCPALADAQFHGSNGQILVSALLHIIAQFNSKYHSV